MKRRIINQIRLSFPSKSVNESLARIVVSAVAMQLDPTVEALADIKTAVSEAVTNAIVHGYREAPGEVQLSAAYYDDGLLRITVKDAGCGIADVKAAMEPLYTTDATGERSGMGFAIMQSFMDAVRVRSKPGVGTKVTMDKYIKS